MEERWCWVGDGGLGLPAKELAKVGAQFGYGEMKIGERERGMYIYKSVGIKIEIRVSI